MMGLFNRAQAADQAAIDNRAMQVAQLPAGRAPVYYAAQGMESAGRRVGSMFGIESPAEKEAKMMQSIYDTLPDDLPNNPEALLKAYSMLMRAGKPEQANKMLDQINKLKDQETARIKANRPASKGAGTEKERYIATKIADCNGDPICLAEVQKLYDKMMAPAEETKARKMYKAADGYYYYADGSRAFPDVKKPESKVSPTTAMQDKQYIAKVELGCDINDPECARRASKAYVEQKRTGPAEFGRRKRSAGEAELMTETQKNLYEAADMADAQIATVDQSLALLDEGIFTGTGGEWVSGIKAALATFGIAEPDMAAGEEQFRVNSMKAIMNWVAQTMGAISEKEMTLFAQASPSLAKTEMGNRLMLKTMREAAEFKRREEQEFNRYVQANPKATITSWRAHRRNWVRDNGFSLPTVKEINAAKKGVSTIPKVSEVSPVSGNPTSKYKVKIVE